MQVIQSWVKQVTTQGGSDLGILWVLGIGSLPDNLGYDYATRIGILGCIYSSSTCGMLGGLQSSLVPYTKTPFDSSAIQHNWKHSMKRCKLFPTGENYEGRAAPWKGRCCPCPAVGKILNSATHICWGT